jgi:hypothetical protein
MFGTFAGPWIPYFYVRAFSAKALGVTPSQSFTILLVLNSCGIAGRTVPALLSDTVLGYIYLQVFTGSIMLLGCGILFYARVAKTGWRVGVKV